MTERAVDAYQAHLDISTRFVFNGDAEGYARHAQLPFVFCTAQGVEVVETAADMAHDIHRMHDAIRSHGATDYHRIARSARYLDTDTIEGFHVTYALRGAIKVFEPYESRMILRRVDDLWKACFAEHELSDPVLSGRNPRALHGMYSDRWAGAEKHAPDNPKDALHVYSARLGSVVARLQAGDVEGWLAHYTWPYTVHYDTGDDVLQTREDADRYVSALQRTMADVGADRLTVQPTMAFYLSEDRLLGYHEISLTRDGECLFGPVQSRIVMVLRDGVWLCNSVANALSTLALARGEMVATDTLPTLREIAKRTKK
jgi:hypothetical protein